MILTHVSLTNFRNFTRLDITVPSRSILLVGANAQGKTSLLEAIYFLATFTSFQADSDRQLINFLTTQEPLAVARIVAEYKRGAKKHHIEVRIIQELNPTNAEPHLHKEVLFDGVKRKLVEVYCQFNAVMFLPQMLTVIDGPPEVRRRYLNLILAQIVPGYAANLSTYTQTVSQRNALLKQLGERNGQMSELIYWDEHIASLGAQLIFDRIQVVRDMEHLAARIHAELTHGTEILRLVYQPAYDPLPQPAGQYALPLETPLDRSNIPLAQIQQGFLERLGQLHAEEIARGVTTIGPHRDELRFLANGIDLGKYGSRGQIRTAMLALKLAEVAWMKEKTGHWPVLLLDEVLAELDVGRRADLLARLTDTEQVFLTTTDMNMFTPEFTRDATVWQIQAGQVI
jgi:DNA replication and repair protein RecF